MATTAIWSLGNIGPEATPAVPALLELLKDKDPWMRGSALTALSKIGARDKAVLPTLIGILKERGTDIQMRGGVAGTLGGIGPEAREAVPLLIELMKSATVRSAEPEVDAAVRAAEALGKIGDRSAVKPLAAALLDRQTHHLVRNRLGYALGDLGDKEAVPALVEAFLSRLSRDGELPDSAQGVTYALLRLGKGAVPHLVAVLKKGDRRAQSMILRLLYLLGPPAKEAEPILEQLQESADTGLAREAGTALARVRGNKFRRF